MKKIDKIKILEENFSKNRYNGDIHLKNKIKIREGKIPIIISAPHSINQIRNGNKKLADVYTGSIALLLSLETGCHTICSEGELTYDPNYDIFENNEYQKLLSSYILEHKINFLIDLHGASSKNLFTVEIGTSPIIVNESSIKSETDPSLLEHKKISSILKMIFDKNLKCFSDYCFQKNIKFTASNQNTITNYISKNAKIPCVQIELNFDYRIPANEEKFLAMYNALYEIIVNINNYLEGEKNEEIDAKHFN